MSLKAELETWAAALKAYDEEDFEKSLDLFSVRPPPSPPTTRADPPRPSAHRRFFKDLDKHGSHICHPRRARGCRRAVHRSDPARPVPCRRVCLTCCLRSSDTHSPPATSSAAYPTFCSDVTTLPRRTSRAHCSISEGTSRCASFSDVPVPLRYSHSPSNYTQLGLSFTLYSAEVLFNKGVWSDHPIVSLRTLQC